MSGISKEIAESEVKSWLEFKKVKADKIERFSKTIESLVGAIMDGSLILDDDKTFIQKLDFPVGAEGAVKELRHKARVSAGQIKINTTGAYSDGDGRIIGIISAVTGLPKNIIENLDTEDYAIAGNISLFFLS
jgi:hypothetical protein